MMRSDDTSEKCVCGENEQVFLLEEACPFIGQSAPLIIVLLTVFSGKVGMQMYSIQPSMSMGCLLSVKNSIYFIRYHDGQL